ncbi:hypothetical protein CPB85DRAFT_1251159 [Mucidula mucida]|nr:hypothetical protein CPB85DRAFT_1251159 [Mucidula mucida]
MSFTAVDNDATLVLSLIHLHELFDDYYRDPALKENRALLPSPDAIFDFCVQHRLLEVPFPRVYRQLRDEYRSISGARDVIEKWCAGQATANTTSPIDSYRKPPARRRPKLLSGERRPRFKTRKGAKKMSTRSAASAPAPSAPSSILSQRSSLSPPLPSSPIDNATTVQPSAEPTRKHSFTTIKLAEGGTTILGDATGITNEVDCSALDATFLARKIIGREQVGAKASEEVAESVQDSKPDAC